MQVNGVQQVFRRCGPRACGPFSRSAIPKLYPRRTEGPPRATWSRSFATGSASNFGGNGSGPALFGRQTGPDGATLSDG